MKTTYVSSAAIQNAMRLTVQRAQSEMVRNQTEIATGRHADMGTALGARTAQSLMLNRDVERLDAILDTNALVTQRLSTSQAALGQISDRAQIMMESLLTLNGSNDVAQIDITKRELINSLNSMTASANISANGEYLFAGVNTDVQPLTDYRDPAGSPAKAAFDAAFLAEFGFPQNDPATQTITATQMQDFLDNTVAPLFSGPAWEATWSGASNTNMSSRINNNEVVDSSSNTNATGFRDFAMAAVIGIELLDLNLNSEARRVVNEEAIAIAGRSISGIDAERAQLGISEARVTTANDAIEAQKKIVATHIGSLEGVDTFEASTRMNTLLTQIEASYALTARIQQLSLMNYL